MTTRGSMSGRPAGGGGNNSIPTQNRNTSRTDKNANETQRRIERGNTRSRPTNNTYKSADKWEHFRDSKMEKMRAHKANVERRMRNGENLDNRMYWNQRNDKLKRYARHESLDPSWYTDNIYSNHSVDLDEEDEDEDDDYFVDNEKFDRYFERTTAEYNAHGGDDANDTFERKIEHLPHGDGILNYPKSRSCCFGGGYNERPKPQLMPKSSSFSVTTTATRGMMDMRSTRFGRHSEMAMDFYGNNGIDNNNISYRKMYCWQNRDRDTYDKYGGEVKEIYHIDRDRDIYKQSKNDIMMEQQTGNANCIRNIWRRRMQCKNNNYHEVNGNYQNDYDAFDKYRLERAFDACHFVEEYLIVPDPMKARLSEPHIVDPLDLGYPKRHNSLDHKLLNDTIDDLNGDNSNLMFSELPMKPRSKNMLEVKIPNRYDDSSSDSTDLDLDDFNFDFEKYWSEMDYRNNNVNDNRHFGSGVKDKNHNGDKYNNRLNRDVNLNDDSDSTVDFKQNIFDLLPSPTHHARPPRPFTTNHKMDATDVHNQNYRDYHDDSGYRRPRLESTITSDINKLSPIDDEPTAIPIFAETTKHTPDKNNSCTNGRKSISGNRKKGRNNSTLSLINNIFSIYKPKKYSPVNGRSRTKADVISKGLNVASTVRPLGATYSEYITSEKRPLTVTTPRYTGARPVSATIDQPYFKIIPEKTGLKISPLYRFGYEDDSKLRLKCTARPLLFPL